MKTSRQVLQSQVVLATIFLISLVGLAAVGYITYHTYRQDFRDQVANQLSAVAQLKITRLAEWRQAQLQLASFVSEGSYLAEEIPAFLQNPTDGIGEDSVQRWLESLRAFGGYQAVYLTDLHGSALISAPFGASAFEPHWEIFSNPDLVTRDPVFLDFHQHADQSIHLAVLAPIFDEAGEGALGFLVMDIDPSNYLYPFLSEWPVPTDSSETLLVRCEGDEVLFLNALRFQPEAAMRLRLPLTRREVLAVRGALGETGVLEGRDYRGVPVVGAVMKVPDTDWILVSKMDQEELYAPLAERLRNTIAFLSTLLAMVALALLAIWWQQRLQSYRLQLRVEKRQAALAAARLRLLEFSSHHGVDEFLGEVLDVVGELTNSSLGFFRLLSSDQGHIDQTVYSTSTRDYCRIIDRRKGENYTIQQAGIWAECIDTRAPVVHNDYKAIPQRKGLPTGHAPLQREVFIPILRGERVAAILGMANKPQDYTAEDVEILSYFAELAWEVCERMRAHETLQRYSEELEVKVSDRTRELREAQEKLIAQERLAVLGQLAGGVSHELRNPLGVIANAVAFLKMAQPDASAKIQEYLDIIDQEVRLSNRIISDLLAFARAPKPQPREVKLGALIQEVLRQYPLPADILLQLDFPDDLPVAWADPDHLVYVLGNLMLNACQAMASDSGIINPDRNEIRLKAFAHGSELCLQVEDQGIGMSADQIERLFEPLFTTKPRGIGLGLAISKRFLEANGGRFEVTSQPGRGSTFSIYLPLVEVH